MLPHPQRRLILYRTALRLSRVFSLFSLGPPSCGDGVYYNRLLRKCQPLFQKNFVAAARRPCSCQRGEIGGSCARQHGPRRQSAGADGALLSIPAAPSFASPRRDGGGAFVHPRSPVLRQPPPGRRRGLCPSPQPCPSPAPAGTAEGPLSIPAAPSFASPRRDGGGAFIHPRGPVLRQPPPGRRRGLCPSPRPCPSPAPAGTAEEPLSIAAALSFASLPCEREGDRRQAVEGFCPQLRPGRGNPRQLRPASSLANRSRIS